LFAMELENDILDNNEDVEVAVNAWDDKDPREILFADDDDASYPLRIFV